MDYVINTENLSKDYGSVRAVDSISLNIRKGEIYGFLGMNGAGKTTTIQLLLGIVAPTEGKAYLFGEEVNPSKSELWNKIGYIVENPHSYPELTVKENLEITRRLRGVPAKKTVDEIMDRLKLEQYRNMRVQNLSSGNSQRLGLAKALLHDPEILLLDEPTKSLDPAGIVEIRKLLSELASKQDVTIFVSSHILSEISKLATRIGIIHRGQLVQEANKEQLEEVMQKRLIVNAQQQEEAKRELSRSGFSVSVEGETLAIRDTQALKHPERVSSLLVEAGYPPTLLKVEEEDLEAYFLRLTGVSQGDIK